MEKFKSEIIGHLDIIVAENEEEFDGNKMQWKEVLIHGDPEGLKSLAKLLLELANCDQDSVEELPTGAREHIHLRPKFDLAKSSVEVIVGRLDAKGTGVFYDKYVPKYIGLEDSLNHPPS
jgi:hypothetical protein